MLNPSVWPEFMLNDAVSNRLWRRLKPDFAEFQFVLCDAAGTVIAVGNTLPLVWDGTLDGLPPGWDDALERGVDGFDRKHAPTTLCALSATVALSLQGKGLSRWVVRGMKAVAARHGLNALIAPVRPTLKSRYPLTPIERYVQWTRSDGQPFDPWLRVHRSLGAELMKLAPESMRIVGTIAEWETWTEMRFPDSGLYIVPGALEPVTIDREQDCGRYLEPNVWMRHPITADDLESGKSLG